MKTIYNNLGKIISQPCPSLAKKKKCFNCSILDSKEEGV